MVVKFSSFSKTQSSISCLLHSFPLSLPIWLREKKNYYIFQTKTSWFTKPYFMLQFPHLRKMIHQRYHCNLIFHYKIHIPQCILQNYSLIQWYSNCYTCLHACINMFLKQLDNEKNTAEMKIVIWLNQISLFEISWFIMAYVAAAGGL